MTRKDLERIYDYGYWANRRLFEVAAELTPEQFTQTVAGSYGSVRNTLVHTLSAEWGWLERCGGPARGPMLRPDDYPTLESVSAAWSRVEQLMRTFLMGLSDGDLSRLIAFKSPSGEARSMALGEMLQHGANHGVHHRGQIVLLLRVLGLVPVNFDMVFYDLERRTSDSR